MREIYFLFYYSILVEVSNSVSVESGDGAHVKADLSCSCRGELSLTSHLFNTLFLFIKTISLPLYLISSEELVSSPSHI